jgi:hypothetical protein
MKRPAVALGVELSVWELELVKGSGSGSVSELVATDNRRR